MPHHNDHRLARLACLAMALGTHGLARAADAAPFTPPSPWFVYTIVFTVVIGSIITLLVIRSALVVSPWSLADALSEPTDVTAMELDAAGVKRIKLDAEGKPMIVTEMRASSSRVIALMGLIVLLLIFLGFGAFSLAQFATSGTMPDSIDQVVHFLMSGLTLFAPYAVNKFASVFESFAPKKT